MVNRFKFLSVHITKDFTTAVISNGQRYPCKVRHLSELQDPQVALELHPKSFLTGSVSCRNCTVTKT
ncbi:uncharacterized [Tachysurus ichikawai]